VIDPLAGSFRGWSEDGDYTKFYTDHQWHNDMLPAGFGGETMPPDYYKRGLPWLASQMVSDPRFAISAVYTAYEGITGHKPIHYPEDQAAPDFNDQLTAWNAQDAFFRLTADHFVKNDYNFKVIVKAIVKSQYFRAIAATNASDTQLTDIGTGRLLTPEMMARKIRAITGIHWGYFEDGYRREMLGKETYQNYFILYGGMDSFNVISHLKQPNGTMAAVSTRMSNELACGLTAWDFTKAADKRRFFPLVDPTIVPESAGNEVPGSVTSIKQNIAYLHHLFLGENLKEDDAEVDRTYRKVFLETWRELNTAQNPELVWECRGRWDPSTGLELTGGIIDDDPNYTIRSWMAVMAYLMMDYRFTFE
jgi:hypothetical protein